MGNTVWVGRASRRAVPCNGRSTMLTCYPQQLLSECQVHKGRTYVNDVARNEPFIAEEPQYEMPKIVVPPGHVSGRTASGMVSVHCQGVA